MVSRKHGETVWEHPADGPWRAITRTADSVTYYPRQPNRHPRFELTLPSGTVLIDDLHAGLVLRHEYYGSFDWDLLVPKGKPLGDRATMKRQLCRATWFRLSFQERYDQSDRPASARLRFVEQFLGQELIRTQEVDAELHPPTAARDILRS